MAVELPTSTPSPTDARRAMTAVLSAMTTLSVASRDAVRWPPDDRAGLLAELDRAVDGLAAARAAVLLAERDAGTWQGSGDPSFAAWRARTGRTSQQSAASQVREAERLHAVPAVLDAVTAGRITLGHATAIASVAGGGTPAQQQGVLARASQEELLRLAERTDAGTFATTVSRWAAAVDPGGLERDHQAQRRQRFVHLAVTPSGAFLKGRLDSVAGHRVKLALEALTPRPAPDDDRDAGQRCADALDAMAGHILADGHTKPGAHVPPHVSLILTAETWDAARTERDRRRAATAARGLGVGGASDGPDRPGTPVSAEAGSAEAGSAEAESAEAESAEAGSAEAGSAEVGSAPATAPATLEDGTPVPTSELAVLLCDCAVTRVAIDADGSPLNLGRTARVFTGPQRRAVIARDRECIWPECHMPARWCQIHHTRWWERDGGRTAVDEGVLMCNFHHHEVHRQDLAVIRVPGQTESPPGVERAAAPTDAAGVMARADYRVRDRAGRIVGRPTRHPGREPPDDLDLTRSTDPFTGMLVPGFMLVT